MGGTQEPLPRLPVPTIEQTLQTYLRAVRPLLSDAEYSHTLELVQRFKQSPGPRLQLMLEERAANTVNWLSDWWREVAYLKPRTPVVVYSNGAVLFPKQDYTDREGQLRFAAKVVAAVLDYKAMIDGQTLSVDMMGGQRLCMSQHSQMLSGCRIPGVELDTHVLHPTTGPNPPRHITVLHNNQVFSLDVYGEDSRPLDSVQLYQQLETIVEMSPKPVPSIGILTTRDRASWARNYSTIISDQANRSAMEDIQRSICVLCVDGEGQPPAGSDHPRSLGLAQMLHGGGSSWNSANRFFDKILQFIIGVKGVCGLNLEHTPADGPPIAAIAQHVLAFCEKHQAPGQRASGAMTAPRKLLTELSGDILRNIEESKVEADRLVNDVDMQVWVYDRYGRDFPKSVQLSPDGYVQVVLQLAYFRLYGEPCATYESGSLRRFQQGRTDTIRSCSVDSHNFTRAMEDQSVSREVRVELFKKAVVAHRKYADEVISGNGIDRHLLGWKLAAAEAGLGVPALHSDVGYSKFFYFKLSTSQVPVLHDMVLGFGAVVPDGYGVCYSPHASWIAFSVSSYLSCPQTDSKRLASTMKQCLDDIQTLLRGPHAKV
ncbi:carnitine O-acetyltransferase-like [Haliotis cracherodii]|uniref:carnitine O-acetyltransferase-like n=1 Tax=Haliotis cracherodii TaxID=6455 RepID=UPI0039E8229C